MLLTKHGFVFICQPENKEKIFIAQQKKCCCRVFFIQFWLYNLQHLKGSFGSVCLIFAIFYSISFLLFLFFFRLLNWSNVLKILVMSNLSVNNYAISNIQFVCKRNAFSCRIADVAASKRRFQENQWTID